MYYLFFQIWLWLILAFALGWFAHWYFCCRKLKTAVQDNPSHGDTGTANALSLNAESNTAMIVEPVIRDEWKPQGFATAPEQVDDLKRVKGIGAVIEETLHGLGIYQFAQLAEWTTENVQWVENFLAFPGRIDREDWIEQAKILSSGGSTEFAKRVDKGDVEY